MDKRTIIFSFLFQIILLVSFVLDYYIGSPTGWEGTILAIQLILLVGSIVIAGIAVFILRKKNALWWHGLLISIGSVLLSFGILILITRF